MLQFEIECKTCNQSMGNFRFFNCWGKNNFAVCHDFYAAFMKLAKIIGNFFKITFSPISVFYSSLLYWRQVTSYTWLVTHETWHMTCDITHFYLLFKVMKSEKKAKKYIFLLQKRGCVTGMPGLPVGVAGLGPVVALRKILH